MAQIAGRLRGKVVQFSGKLSVRLPKVMRRFVAEMIYGIAAWVLATAYFTAVHPGLRSKLEIVAAHALRAAKRIFGVPDFRYYALADGIKDILSRSRRGIDLKATGTQPQLQLPLLL